MSTGIRRGEIRNGVGSSISTTSATNFTAPSQITTGSFTNNLAYNPSGAPTSESGPNGFSIGIGYDTMARPSSSTSPFGATTYMGYDAMGSAVSTSVNGRWTNTTNDGLGRPIVVYTGYSSTTISQAETEYDSCGCSPLGKMKRTAMPHAYGTSPSAWTTYTYDGIGRTLSVLAADAASTTSYVYQGNTVTATDPAGKWKKYTTNVLGQLIQVNEPNPAGGSDYVTTYTYDILGHLTGVSMPRPTGTQTRTFNYGTPPGALLVSATNPENGTVSYTYNSYQKIATKTDAKGQQVQYSYDSYARLTQVRHYVSGTEDTCQQVNYYYDSDYGSGFSTNVSGRLATVVYKNGWLAPYGCDTTFTEMYNYNSAGARIGKRMRLSRAGQYFQDLDGGYTYDTEGKMLTQQYPSGGPNVTYGYDSMGRLQTFYDGTNNVISSTTYGPAGELTAMSGTWGSESRSYNTMLQMTSLSSSGGGSAWPVSKAYNFSTGGANNGKIVSEHDYNSGEDVVYAYDSLNRLASAGGSGWGQSYAYDGFGNLTDITTTAGTTPEWHAAYNASNNRTTSDTADANGNIGLGATYDVENRLVVPTNSVAQYAYAPDNKRVWKAILSVTGRTSEEVTFWSVTGQRIATYSVAVGGLTLTGTEYYFGGKLIKNVQGMVHADRLGSIGKYYPYGQDRPGNPDNVQEKFATYKRDGATGLDYAINRYHAPGQGRFLSPDPYMASIGPTDPGSWNRYAYTEGDPLNFVDSSGLTREPVGLNPLFAPGSPDPDPDPVPPQRPSGPGDGGLQATLNRLKRNVVDPALRRASDLIENQGCASLFLSGEDNTPAGRELLSQRLLTNLDEGGQIGVLSAGAAAKVDPNLPAFTTPDGFIWIIQGRAFFTNQNPTGGSLTGAFSNLTLHQVQDLTIIHEFMHQVGLVGPDDDHQVYTLANGQQVTGSAGISKAIRDNCFN